MVRQKSWVFAVVVLFWSVSALAAENLEITFSGLLTLSSDRGAEPSVAWVLAPNAMDPMAPWLPEAFRLRTPHEVTLLIVDGKRDPSSTVLLGDYKWCLEDTTTTRSGLRVSTSDIKLLGLSGDLSAIRTAREDPNTGDKTTLAYLADLEAVAGHSGVAEISPQLMVPTCGGSCSRLAARLHLEGGKLSTKSIWAKPDDTMPEIDFLPGTMHRQHLASSFQLSSSVSNNKLTIEIRPLGMPSAEPGRLIVAPESPGAGIHVVLQNAPAACHDPYHEDHFRYHYLLRNGWDSLGDSAELVSPDPDGTKDSTDNPQCSPADQKHP